MHMYIKQYVFFVKGKCTPSEANSKRIQKANAEPQESGQKLPSTTGDHFLEVQILSCSYCL